MILIIHYGALYFSAPKAKSSMAGHFFLWWLPQVMQPKNCMDLYKLSHLSSDLLLHLLLKQRLVLSASMPKREKSFQPTTPIDCDDFAANGIANDTVNKIYHDSWRCVIFALQIKLHKIISLFTGTQVKVILQTTSLNITCLHITHESVHIISTLITPLTISLEPMLQVLCKVSFEYTPMDMLSIMHCPYFQ